MSETLNRKDGDLLAALADYRMLTTSQIAALSGVGSPAARKRLRKLKQVGLVDPLTCALTGHAGRPEELNSLTTRGVAWLQAQGRLAKSMSAADVTGGGVRCVAHQLLVNWFRIHLVHATRSQTNLSANFLAPNSALLEHGPDGRACISEAVRNPNDGERISFPPDGVFIIHHAPSDKTLLFFLEVDMGTEKLIGEPQDSRTVGQKIQNYQQYFRADGYKRYEQLFDSELSGFRLLFVSNTAQRLRSLCGLIQRTSPSDFIWLTDAERLFAKGVSANIWIRGGRPTEPQESILGKSLCFACPI